MSERVSAIIPAFNAADYLAWATESVRSQSDTILEIIVVDDGSTDTTAQVAQSMPDVRYIRQENAGPAAARNTGIRAAQGEFFSFLDADDLWAKGKLAAQLEVFQNYPEIDLVAGQVEEFETVAPCSGTHPTRTHGQRAYTVGALLIRRSGFFKVGWFDESLRSGEFIDWLSRAKAAGLREHVLDQVVLYRRLHAHNTTRLAEDHQRHYLATIRRHLERKRSAPDKRVGGTP